MQTILFLSNFILQVYLSVTHLNLYLSDFLNFALSFFTIVEF